MSNMGSSTTYTAPKGQTTEWDDIQRKLGNLPPLPDEKVEEEEPPEVVVSLEEALEEALEGKDMDDVDEYADDADGDDTFMAEYRRKRLEQMKEQAKKEIYGRVLPLVKPDFVKEVSEGSNDCWVIVHLHQDYLETSNHLCMLMEQLAAKHRAAKFMRIKADACIEDYPDKHVPTTLVYKDNECKTRIVGLSEFGGPECSAKEVEWVLATLGAVETDLESDPRERRMRIARGADVRRLHGGLSDEDDD